MKLNFLGKAAIATAGLYAASKLLETNEEDNWQPPGRSGEKLFSIVQNSFFGAALLPEIRYNATCPGDWDGFNEAINRSVIRDANHQERCNLWNYLRS